MEEQAEKKDLGPPPAAIGAYQVLKRLGRGGMGEVLLAKDPVCNRALAIKRVRSDLVNHDVIRQRFLNEAKITASLCHPSIIPVYSIHQSDDELYYVMPYVEGETLKVLLRSKLAINTGIRIFQNICQAISYCHSRGILHRDLKPENILVGHFGQVLIFDWGLAGHIGEKEKEGPDLPEEEAHLTRPGKVLGTLSYMPPERVKGRPADISTDIYSLGVILYQILTLRMPFHRTTIEEYKRFAKYEKLVDALEAAPYRDIPPQLSAIAKKCLAEATQDRYKSVSELLVDLERYNAGLPDWIFAGSLDVKRAEDWELQENVLLSKLIAITRSTEIMHWYFLMISKTSFSGNKKIKAKLTLKKDSEGVGFLFNIPEPKEREGLEDGYLIWIGSKKNPGIKLCRSSVSIFDIPERYLEEDATYTIEIEKADQQVRLYLNETLIMDYNDPLPIIGTHVGLLCQDMEFQLESFQVFVGSQTAVVGCLSIPDAFLASKNFQEALEEYERIAESFAGRIQGREAMFRSGITYIEMAKSEENRDTKESLYEQALKKFEELHHTVSEPLEYLGKSLVYHKKEDLEEELKCLELGIRKFKRHPLIHLLEERIIFRLHECAKGDREGIYNFALLILRHLQARLSNRETHALIHNLQNNSEGLYFAEPQRQFPDLPTHYHYMASTLAFWLNKPIILKDLLSEDQNNETIKYLLAALGHGSPPDLRTDLRTHFFHIDKKLNRNHAHELTPLFERLNSLGLEKDTQKKIDALHLWQLLLIRNYEAAEAIFERYPRDSNEKCSSPFFMLMGCYLAKAQGHRIAMNHFERSIDYAFPPLYSLLAHSLKATIRFEMKWQKQAFYWEKIMLYRQSILFYHSLGKKTKVAYLERKLKKLRNSHV